MGSRSVRRLLLASSVPAAFLVVGIGLWQVTAAAFQTTTNNTANTVAAGTVIVSNDAGTAMFAATGLDRGDSQTRCIRVQYDGSLAATVKLYTSSATGTLGPYLNVTVEQGSGGTFASCSGFGSATTIYTGTLANLASTSTSFANGVGSWSPTAAGQARTYRITTTLSATAPAAAAESSAGITLVWEARNT